MKKHLTNNLLHYPIWKIILYDENEFFILGKDKKDAISNIILVDNIYKHDIKDMFPITIEEAQNILIDVDGGFYNFDTLYNEAIWIQYDTDLHYLICTCYDLIADLNLIYNAN